MIPILLSTNVIFQSTMVKYFGQRNDSEKLMPWLGIGQGFGALSLSLIVWILSELTTIGKIENWLGIVLFWMVPILVVVLAWIFWVANFEGDRSLTSDHRQEEKEETSCYENIPLQNLVENTGTKQNQIKNVDVNPSHHSLHQKIKFNLLIVKTTWRHLLCMFTNMSITLAIFPNVLTLVRCNQNNSSYTRLDYFGQTQIFFPYNKLYVFVIYQAGDLLGKYLANYGSLLKKSVNMMIIATLARSIFIFLIFLSQDILNFSGKSSSTTTQNQNQSMTSSINSHHALCIYNLLFSLSAGYLFNIQMSTFPNYWNQKQNVKLLQKFDSRQSESKLVQLAKGRTSELMVIFLFIGMSTGLWLTKYITNYCEKLSERISFELFEKKVQSFNL